MALEPRSDQQDTDALDPRIEALATTYLTHRRGKAQWSGPPSLAKLAARLVPEKARASGIGISQLSLRWRDIVGDKIASISQPDAIKGETLVIKVVAAAAPLLTMRSAEIIGLVRLAGANKIKRLSFVRAPLSNLQPQRTPPRAAPMDAAAQRARDKMLEQVETPELKDALRRLADATSNID
ncbi:MAG: hypothetical protein RL186_718 [Pseudomonadota bacterium]